MNIKINRARKLSATGRYPGTCDAMLKHISRDVAAAVPARILALIIDDLYDASQAAKAIADREAVAEGVVWDAGRLQLRDLN